MWAAKRQRNTARLLETYSFIIFYNIFSTRLSFGFYIVDISESRIWSETSSHTYNLF